MHPILFQIGPITVYTYGFFITLGILVGFYFVTEEAKRQGINKDKILNFFLLIIISGFVGSRIVYIFTEWGYFLKSPARMLFAREGFVFYGGFIAALLASLWYAKKIKLPFWQMADIFSPAIAIAHSIGRIGCFFYGCCYGEIPFGKFAIPTQLAESGVLFIIFCILIILRIRKKFDGEIFWLYVLLYAIARFVIEFYRQDPRGHIWIFSTSQFIAIFAAIAAVVMLTSLRSRHRREK